MFRSCKSYNLGLKGARSHDVLAMHLSSASTFALTSFFSCLDRLRFMISLEALLLAAYCRFGIIISEPPRVMLHRLLLPSSLQKQLTISLGPTKMPKKTLLSLLRLPITSNLLLALFHLHPTIIKMQLALYQLRSMQQALHPKKMAIHLSIRLSLCLVTPLLQRNCPGATVLYPS